MIKLVYSKTWEKWFLRISLKTYFKTDQRCFKPRNASDKKDCNQSAFLNQFKSFSSASCFYVSVYMAITTYHGSVLVLVYSGI